MELELSAQPLRARRSAVLLQAKFTAETQSIAEVTQRTTVTSDPNA